MATYPVTARGNIRASGRELDRAASLQWSVKLKRGVIAVVMFVCAFLLWTLVPAGVLWVLPRVIGVGSALPVLGLVSVTVTMIALGQVLAYLNRLYCGLIAEDETPRLEDAWRRPICSTDEGQRGARLVEKILALSFLSAAATAAVWFFFLSSCSAAGCYAPS